MRTQGSSQPERFLSAEEVADLFGMSRDWVYDRALSGDLPSYKLPGGKRRFLLSELMDAVALGWSRSSISS